MKLDELEKLLSEATPGPWARADDCNIFDSHFCGIKSEADGFNDIIERSEKSSLGDIDFICALRNNAEKLIAVVRAATILLDATPRGLEQWSEPLEEALANLDT